MLATLAALCALAGWAAAQTCDAGWTLSTTTGSCYRFVASPTVNTAAAAAACAGTSGGHLLIIDQVDEAKISVPAVLTTLPSAELHVGVTRQATDVYVWDPISPPTSVPAALRSSVFGTNACARARYDVISSNADYGLLRTRK
jgi:hypothetical protein